MSSRLLLRNLSFIHSSRLARGEGCLIREITNNTNLKDCEFPEEASKQICILFAEIGVLSVRHARIRPDATMSNETCCVPCEVRQESWIAKMLNEVAPNGLRNTCPASITTPELAV